MCRSASNGVSLRESRIIFYESNTERLIKETPVYAENIDNPIEAITHTFAAVTHVATGAIDSLLGDGIRLLQGKENRIPLKEYSGDLPRLKLDGSEAVQSITNIVHTKGLSLLSLPIIALKATGDGISDGMDLFAGVHRELAA